MSDITSEAISSLQSALAGSVQPSAADQYVSAVVTEAGKSGVWVRFDGADGVTPIESITSAVKPGDKVSVRVSDGVAYIVGNTTAPATDDTAATRAEVVAQTAVKDAQDAAEAAESAINDAAIARESADKASEAAEQAISDAHSANVAANLAISDAARANSAANEAQADASAAKGAADQAQADATTAKTSAEQARREASTASTAAASAGVSAARAQAALDTIGDYDWDAESFNPNGSLFYKDELGAHIVDALGADGTYRTDIDSSGMTVTEIATGDTVARFGTEAQVGKESGGHFNVKPDRLQGFDGDDKYFEVSADGLYFGAGLESKAATKDEVDSILVFDTDYDIVGGSGNPKQAEFHAHVYRSGVEVTSEFPDDYFRWFIKNEDNAAYTDGGNTDSNLYATGKTCTITIDEGYIGYGATIVGVFEPVEMAGLLSVEGEEVQTSDGDGIMVLSAGAKDGYISVTDLSEEMPKAADYLMGWGNGTYKSQVQNYMDLSRVDIEEKSELTAAQVADLLTI